MVLAMWSRNLVGKQYMEKSAVEIVEQKMKTHRQEGQTFDVASFLQASSHTTIARSSCGVASTEIGGKASGKRRKDD
jgi:hypothetical protein